MERRMNDKVCSTWSIGLICRWQGDIHEEYREKKERIKKRENETEKIIMNLCIAFEFMYVCMYFVSKLFLFWFFKIYEASIWESLT